MKEVTDWIVIDGKITAAKEPVAPATSRGLMYGDGAFETFRVYEARTFLLKEHLQRLKEALKVLGISFPSKLNSRFIRDSVYQLLEKKDLINAKAIVRLQVWRDGKRGYGPDANASSHFAIIISESPDSFEPPALATVEKKRIPAEALPSSYKFTNGINYILAAREAAQKDADDALMETIEGYISETTIANIFWIKENRVFTPSVKCDLVPGITRRIIIKLIDQVKTLQIEVGKYPLRHLLNADGVWITNSVREVLPVAAINETSFTDYHEGIEQLQQNFIGFRNSKLKSLIG